MIAAKSRSHPLLSSALCHLPAAAKSRHGVTKTGLLFSVICSLKCPFRHINDLPALPQRIVHRGQGVRQRDIGKISGLQELA